MMIPLSRVYSYLNIPENDWNQFKVDIYLYNALKAIGISALQEETKLLNIEDYKACIGDNFEYIKAVVVKVNTKDEPVKPLKVEDGEIIVTYDEYPIVQQTVNNQISAIYPLLPYFFPTNNSRISHFWEFVKPRNILFSKVCKECPTYCNECELVYDMTMDNCLHFPQIEEGIICVNYTKITKTEEILIQDDDQLLNGLATYVSKMYWEYKEQLEYTQQARDLADKYDRRWRSFKASARSQFITKSLDIVKIKELNEEPIKKMLYMKERTSY